METARTLRPTCPACQGTVISHGRDRKGNPRFLCRPCNRRLTVAPPRPLGEMRLPLDKATMCVSLLVEGSSIRATERITGVHRDTIMRLLVKVGGKCEALLERLVSGVKVSDVQADELWSFVGMKEKTKTRKQINDPKLGDAYAFVAIDRESKLVLAHHLGRRSNGHADLFAEKLSRAIDGEQRVQISTDGFAGYPQAIEYHFGDRADFAQVVKEFGSPGAEELRRYSPPRLIAVERTVVSGNPDEDRISTSHVERLNLSIRTSVKRMARLTCAFSRKWENLRAALALNFAAYNFTRMHRSIRMTPAMKAGVARKPWTVAELVAA